MRELPSNDMWCGQKIPVEPGSGKTVFEVLTKYEGVDIIRVREIVTRRFRLTKDQFNYWLGEWRFTKR